MTVNSLLPAHFDQTEHAMDKTVGTRLGAIRDIEDPWNEDVCPEELLDHLAYQMSVDIWEPNWPAQTKRAVIKASKEVHIIKGTVKSIRVLLKAAGYGEARIIEGRNYSKYDGTYKYDGVKTYGDKSTWTQNIFIFSQSISNKQAARFTELFNNVAPARSILHEIRYNRTIHHDGEIKYNGEFKYGVFSNA